MAFCSIRIIGFRRSRRLFVRRRAKNCSSRILAAARPRAVDGSTFVGCLYGWAKSHGKRSAFRLGANISDSAYYIIEG